jgi:hypothetical protein
MSVTKTGLSLLRFSERQKSDVKSTLGDTYLKSSTPCFLARGFLMEQLGFANRWRATL